MRITAATRPQAIAMWDFSWLERRWPGAGFEDWDAALSQLAERGYDIVRIDAYPHLVSAGPDRTWTLRPRWTQQSWGAQSMVQVQVLPALLDFIRTAAQHGIEVALSSWFREDLEDSRMLIQQPADMANAWLATLHAIHDAELLEHIVMVDLCNEFPQPAWAPFLYGTDLGKGYRRGHPLVGAWMRESIDTVRASFPSLDYTYSFSDRYDDVEEADVSALDVIEPHIWMAGVSDFNKLVGYNFERFETTGYDNLVIRGRSTYEKHRTRLDNELLAEIDRVAQWSRNTNKLLVTSEGWSVIDYKDWPGLDWEWVKSLNERVIGYALRTGRWTALATSNFCAPQFVGMWRDIDYHQRLTMAIHNSSVDPSPNPRG